MYSARPSFAAENTDTDIELAPFLHTRLNDLQLRRTDRERVAELLRERQMWRDSGKPNVVFAIWSILLLGGSAIVLSFMQLFFQFQIMSPALVGCLGRKINVRRHSIACIKHALCFTQTT